jgi:hypothetical protein
MLLGGRAPGGGPCRRRTDLCRVDTRRCRRTAPPISPPRASPSRRMGATRIRGKGPNACAARSVAQRGLHPSAYPYCGPLAAIRVRGWVGGSRGGRVPRPPWGLGPLVSCQWLATDKILGWTTAPPPTRRAPPSPCMHGEGGRAPWGGGGTPTPCVAVTPFIYCRGCWGLQGPRSGSAVAGYGESGFRFRDDAPRAESGRMATVGCRPTPRRRVAPVGAASH